MLSRICMSVYVCVPMCKWKVLNSYTFFLRTSLDVDSSNEYFMGHNRIRIRISRHFMGPIVSEVCIFWWVYVCACNKSYKPKQWRGTKERKKNHQPASESHSGTLKYTYFLIVEMLKYVHITIERQTFQRQRFVAIICLLERKEERKR